MSLAHGLLKLAYPGWKTQHPVQYLGGLINHTETLLAKNQTGAIEVQLWWIFGIYNPELWILNHFNQLLL